MGSGNPLRDYSVANLIIDYKMENNPQEKKKNKKLGLIVAFLVPIFAIIASILLVQRDISLNTILKENSTEKTDLEEQEEPSVFARNLEPIYTRASRLVISSVNININLESVGVDSEGTMETPENWLAGGWYVDGGMPGESRNMIINGHYDTNYGSPGAFYHLRNVKEGDTIEIVDRYGRIFIYKVLELFYLDIEDPTRLDILDDEEGKSTLTLITCGGVWLSGSGYNKRLVVKGEFLKI